MAVRPGTTIGRSPVTVQLDRSATASAPPQACLRLYGCRSEHRERLDLPAKVFGQPVFIHDMVLDGMRHARVVRQPQRGATLRSLDEAAIRRAASGPIEFVRHGNFLAIVGDDETAVEAASAAAVNHVTWHGVEPRNPQQQEARWLLQQPVDRSHDRGARAVAGRARAATPRGHLHEGASRPCVDRAVLRARRVSRRSPDGVDPCPGRLSAAGSDARSRSNSIPTNVSVRHVQGSGCYGHNGADDAAADAAVIATRLPGTPIRVRWRREEEFAFEPVGPAMVVKVARGARRGRPPGRLDRGNLERHAQRPTGQRQSFGGRGAAQSAATAGAHGCARCWRWRRHPQWRAAL